MKWAILSGIEGNLAAYEAVLADIKQQRRGVEAIYILGDLVGLTPESEQVVKQVRNPRNGEIQPLVCRGWWEEQCLLLHGMKGDGQPRELIDKYGAAATKTLWDCISQETVRWMTMLDFGFFELDCLLIHGSTVAVEEELTPETSPILMVDRLSRMQANNLFCGRSGLMFQYHLEAGAITSDTTTLDGQIPSETIGIYSTRQVIGVGNVGRTPGEASYTIYNPSSNQVEFKTIYYGKKKGFSRSKD